MSVGGGPGEGVRRPARWWEGRTGGPPDGVGRGPDMDGPRRPWAWAVEQFLNGDGPMAFCLLSFMCVFFNAVERGIFTRPARLWAPLM